MGASVRFQQITAWGGDIMSSNGDAESLRRDASDALHGARDVVHRLDVLMKSGAPSIADMAYTTRIREKEDFKIVEKVERKRKDDPVYSVSKIRDIVGLRVVTIYRLDALEIIPVLVNLMRKDSGTATSLFVEPTFEEIMIYSTNPETDAQALPERLKSVFESLGLDAKLNEKPSSYTSIHLVTWCQGKYGGKYVKVPLEIQIRTALEDAWAEIDHKLRYKPKARKLSVRDETILGMCLTHLNIMKNFVDGAAQYADQIRVQSDQVTARRFVSTTHRIVQDTSAIVHNMVDLPAPIRTQIGNALEHQRDAMHLSRRNKQYAEDRVGNLRNAIRELLASIDLVAAELPPSDANRALLLNYYLPLELALCQFQLGIELKQDKKLFAEAIRIYQTVQDLFPNDAAVRYRYGRTLASLGDFPAAIQKLREANELLLTNTDGRVDPHHWIRLSVPRNLGVYYWELAEAQRGSAPTDKTKLKAREFYLEAYKVTKAAEGLRVDPDADAVDEFDKKTNYLGRMYNNLLYYIQDFLEAGGKEEELAKFGYKPSDVESYLGLFEEHLSLIETPETLHTMLRHYRRLGLHQKAALVAPRLLKLLQDQGVVDSGGLSHEEEMLRMALDTLAGEAPSGT
jgi:ppGpp synthetase/RelA/SpoT-type nucleotidyltranferase